MKVHDGLYIGSYMAEMNKQGLIRAGITDILQVAQGLFPHHPLIFNYMNIQVQDIPSEDMVRYFPKCFEFINGATSKGGRVLVHCAAGVSRSATVVLGYLMTHHQMDLNAAMLHLKTVRPWVCPNTGFVKQLEAFQGLSHDFSKWPAWHLVWQQQQDGQQHWIPQIGQQQQVGQEQQQPLQETHHCEAQQWQLQQHTPTDNGEFSVPAGRNHVSCDANDDGWSRNSSRAVAFNEPAGHSSSAFAAPSLQHSCNNSSTSGSSSICNAGTVMPLPDRSTPVLNIKKSGNISSSSSSSGAVLLHYGPQLDPWASQ